jgi:PAS domain S-box-containing protein
MTSAVTSQQQIDYYEQILNSIATAITTLTPVRDNSGTPVDFTYKAVNRQWEINNRKSAGEVVGRRLLDVYPQMAVSATLPLIMNLSQTGHSFQATDFFILEGRLVHYEIRGVRLGEDLVLSINDITPYWQTQQELKQQSELFRSVVDNAPTGIILAEAIRDSEQRIIDYRYRLTNSFNAQLTGHTVEQMIGKQISELFAGWQSLQLFETFKAVTETGETQRYPFEYDSYGVKGWFEGSFVKQDDGVLFTFLDVSAIKQAEVEQEIQAQRLKAILDNSQTAISLHEAIRNEQGELVDFKTVTANRLALEQWGPLADQILHKPYSQISPNPNAATEFARFKQVIETGETLVFEFNYAEDWHLMAIAKMGDGLVISFINITDTANN